jgi:nicotinamide riboside kinase
MSAPLRPRVIALIGAESTGKSTLATALSAHLGAVVVPEVLREFVSWHGRPPGRWEQLAIFRRQLGRELRARELGGNWVVCDPSAAMTSIYSQAYFADHSLHPAARTLLDGCYRVLWCRPDIPWSADAGQRDGPGMREQVDAILANFVSTLKVSPGQIHGATPQVRLASALRALG